MKWAYQGGFDWIWVMDDDVEACRKRGYAAGVPDGIGFHSPSPPQ